MGRGQGAAVTVISQSPVLDRVKCVIAEMRRYGVSEVFEPEDMMVSQVVLQTKIFLSNVDVNLIHFQIV